MQISNITPFFETTVVIGRNETLLYRNERLFFRNRPYRDDQKLLYKQLCFLG